jgi:hypothetical protein
VIKSCPANQRCMSQRLARIRIASRTHASPHLQEPLAQRDETQPIRTASPQIQPLEPPGGWVNKWRLGEQVVVG